jgi:AraC-like DNA-binding protein
MPHPALPFIYHPRFSRTALENAPNWHENIEFLQATEGSGYVLCGAEKLPLTPQTVVVVNADTLHCIGTDSQVVHRCLIIDNSFFLANGVPINSLYFQSLIKDPQVSALLDTIAQAYAQYDPEDYRSILAIRSPVLQLVQLLCLRYTSQKPDNPANEYVKKAMVFLRQNHSKALSLDALAEAVGISKYHLCRQFKLFTGKTIVQTINQMRCMEARRLIEGGMPVSAAAPSCGFDNLSYFTRTYKKYLGSLPSEHMPK